MRGHKIFFSIIILSLIITSAFLSEGMTGTRYEMGQMPAPRLMAPSDIVDLTGKKEIEFRWGTETGNFNYYDFRVYKGAQTIESGLFIKKQIPIGASSVRIDAANFERGKTYSWSLRFVGSKKSRSAYSVFKIK